MSNDDASALGAAAVQVDDAFEIREFARKNGLTEEKARHLIRHLSGMHWNLAPAQSEAAPQADPALDRCELVQ